MVSRRAFVQGVESEGWTFWSAGSRARRLGGRRAGAEQWLGHNVAERVTASLEKLLVEVLERRHLLRTQSGQFFQQELWRAAFEVRSGRQAIDEDRVQSLGAGQQDEERQPMIVTGHSWWSFQVEKQARHGLAL